MYANYKKLKQAHARLMSRYIDVLNELSTLPFFVPSRTKVSEPEKPLFASISKFGNRVLTAAYTGLMGFTSLFSLRFLVRLFVESHIRRKLLELSVAYTYLAQKHPGNKAYAAWLRETSEDGRKLADTLTSLQSVHGILSIWWPFLISIATAWLGLESIYDLINRVQLGRSSLILLGLIMVFPLIYLAIFVSYSFSSKRELFTPGFNSHEKSLDPSQPADVGDVVYVLEDQVFQLTGRGKVREFPLDMMSIVTACLVFASVPILLWMADPSSPPGFVVWLSGAVFAIGGVMGLWVGLSRKWR